MDLALLKLRRGLHYGLPGQLNEAPLPLPLHRAAAARACRPLGLTARSSLAAASLRRPHRL